MSHAYDKQKGLAEMEVLEGKLRERLPLFVERYGDEYRMEDGELLTTFLLSRLVSFISDYEESSRVEQGAVMQTVSDLLESLASQKDKSIDALIRTGFFEDFWIMGPMRASFAEKLGPEMRRILEGMQRDTADGSKTVVDPMR